MYLSRQRITYCRSKINELVHFYLLLCYSYHRQCGSLFYNICFFMRLIVSSKCMHLENSSSKIGGVQLLRHRLQPVCYIMSHIILVCFYSRFWKQYDLNSLKFVCVCEYLCSFFRCAEECLRSSITE